MNCASVVAPFLSSISVLATAKHNSRFSCLRGYCVRNPIIFPALQSSLCLSKFSRWKHKPKFGYCQGNITEKREELMGCSWSGPRSAARVLRRRAARRRLHGLLLWTDTELLFLSTAELLQTDCSVTVPCIAAYLLY